MSLKTQVTESEMGFSRMEFFNLIPRALRNYDYRISDEDITIILPAGAIHIHVGTEAERFLSVNVRLPYIPVSMRFEDVEAETRSKFMRQFKASFQKGLG